MKLSDYLKCWSSGRLSGPDFSAVQISTIRRSLLDLTSYILYLGSHLAKYALWVFIRNIPLATRMNCPECVFPKANFCKHGFYY